MQFASCSVEQFMQMINDGRVSYKSNIAVPERQYSLAPNTTTHQSPKAELNCVRLELANIAVNLQFHCSHSVSQSKHVYDYV